MFVGLFQATEIQVGKGAAAESSDYGIPWPINVVPISFIATAMDVSDSKRAIVGSDVKLEIVCLTMCLAHAEYIDNTCSLIMFLLLADPFL